MQRFLPFALLLALVGVGCDVQQLGARCESDLDCDRRTGAEATAVCLSFDMPGRRCGSGMNCLCCPTDTALRSSYPGCGITTADVQGTDATDTVIPTDTTDVPTADASDAASDASDSGTCSMSCGAGFFCDRGMCRPGLSIGARCTDGTQCGSTFCVTGVCCNSACTCAGCGCNVEPDFAGICMRAPADAGTRD